METFCLGVLRAWSELGCRATLYSSYAGGAREVDIPKDVERVCWNVRAGGSFLRLARWLQTRGRQADTALKIVRDVLQEFLANGVRADELKAAQDNMVNGFGLKLDSNAKIRAYAAMIAFYDLPDNWLEMWPKKVAAVTVEEVQDAWRRRLHADALATIVAGGEGDTDEHPAPPPPSAGNDNAHRHTSAPTAP